MPIHADRYQLIQPRATPRRVLIDTIPYIITTDDRNEIVVKHNTSLLIERGIIKAFLNKIETQRYRSKVDLIYRAQLRDGIVVTPGFINAHAHPPMYLLRSATLLHNENATTEESLVVARAIEQAMTVEEQTIAAVGDFTEQQKNGTTCVLSHYHTPQATRPAALQTHMRIVDAVSAASKTDPTASLRRAAQYLKTPSTLITPGLTIHTLQQVSLAQLKAVSTFVRQHRKVILTLHCGETDAEIGGTIQRHGLRPIALLHKVGLLHQRVILSHAVHFTADEIALLIKKKVGVVHLPTSNRIHRSGQFNYAEWFALRGHHRIALGTDSVISKSKLDIVSEAFQSKIMHQDSAHPIRYFTLFRMMTINGARILGREHDLGRVWPGYQADLAFWKLKDRVLIPFDRKHPTTLIGNLITHGGSQVRDLMIGGRFVVSNRRHALVDESNLLRQLQINQDNLRKRI